MSDNVILDRDRPIVDLESMIVTINKGMELMGTEEKKVELNDEFLEAVEVDLITLFELKDKFNVRFAEA